jgi:tetratricopeptide (TPR) repeat protein
MMGEYNMLCPKCGKENPENAAYCNYCGKSVSENNSKQTSNIKILAKKYIIFSALTISLLIIISIIFITLSSPIAKYKNAIKDNNIVKASKIYEAQLKGNKNKEKSVEAFLISNAEGIRKEFLANKLELGEALLKLEPLDRTRLIYSEVEAIKSEINKINMSRMSFNKGKEFIKNMDYKNGVIELKKVIPEDENYEKAQEQIEFSLKDYKTQVLVEVDKAAGNEDFDTVISTLYQALTVMPNDPDFASKREVYVKLNEEKKAEELRKRLEEMKANQEVSVDKVSIVIQSTQYKALYPDMIQAIIRNNSDKTIKNFKIGFLAFDSNGYPLKIKAQFDFSGGSFEFLGNADNVNIVPKSTFGKNVGWTLDENHGIKTVIACVQEVDYYDNSRWENPYYDYWLREYKEKPLH